MASSNKSRSSKSRRAKASQSSKKRGLANNGHKVNSAPATMLLIKDEPVAAPPSLPTATEILNPVTLLSPDRINKLKLALPVFFGAYIASFAMWQDKVGNVVTGLGLGGWGDLLFHIRAAVFFAEQGGWPRESFFLAGQPVGYAFFADYLTGLLWRFGFSTAASFAIPTIVLVAIFVVALEWTVLRITKSVRAAILSIVLFMGFGGLSGWSILRELSPDSWTRLRELPHGITVWREANYAVLNPFVMMLHQRSFLLGFPLFVVLLYLSWKFLHEKSLPMLALITLATTLLALFHPFTWLAFLMIFSSWMVWMIFFRVRSYTHREIAATIVALAMSGLAGFLIIKGLQPSAGASSITWRPGWLATDINWLSFWVRNIGLYLILGPVAVYYLFHRIPGLALLALASLTPFVAANLFQFAPWDWDNTKIFAPVWVILSIAVATLLASWWDKNELSWKGLSLAALSVLLLSGGLEVARVITFRSTPMTISSVADLSMGEAIRSRVGKRDVMLSEPEASHPIFMYSGRPSFVAYDGWLWSQGWKGKYEQRMIDKKIIYEGTENSRDLINKNQIDYVVIGPPELKAGANKQWFDSNYSPVLSLENYTLYDVRQQRITSQASAGTKAGG